MEEIRAITESLSGHQTPTNDLFTKLDYLENQSRRNNLVIDGIPDSKSWSDTESKAKKLFSDHLKIDPKLIEIERAHRIENYGHTGHPRSIELKLPRFKDKEEIMKCAKGTNFFLLMKTFQKVSN